METLTSSKIQKLFKMSSLQTLFNAEERNEIPQAERVARGSTFVRHWSIDQLPEIGKRFGFLKAPETQVVVCVYTQKGGVLKTTISYSMARILALCGIKVLIIGVDIQGSITQTAIPIPQADNLEELKQIRKTWGGLYHLLYDDAELFDVVKKTDLPTLDVIPENAGLRILDRRLSTESNRERYFKNKLLPQLQDYQVIIFDNGPNWNQLVENTLVCSNFIISPVGCDVGTFDVLETNLDQIWEFQKVIKDIQWNDFIMVPTLLEKTKLSSQIYGTYTNTYNKYILPMAIRRAVVGQESSFVKKTAIEHDPKSALAQDYYDVMTAIWARIVR